MLERRTLIQQDKNRTGIKIFVFVLFSLSMILNHACDIKDKYKANVFAKKYISDNEILIGNLVSSLQSLNVVDSIVVFTTKSGSHILDVSNNLCRESITDDEKRNIADYIDLMDLKYIKFKKTQFVVFALPIRNESFKYYLIRKNFQSLKENEMKKTGIGILVDGWFLDEER